MQGDDLQVLPIQGSSGQHALGVDPTQRVIIPVMRIGEPLIRSNQEKNTQPRAQGGYIVFNTLFIYGIYTYHTQGIKV